MRGACVAYGLPFVCVVVVVYVVVTDLCRRPRRRRGLSLIIAIAPYNPTIRLAPRVMKPFSEVANDVSNNF